MQNFIEQFKKEIENFSPVTAKKDAGTVIKVSDGVAEIEGLSGAVMSEMIRFDVARGKPLKDALEGASEVFGVILNLEEESVRAVILGDVGLVREGMSVFSTGTVLSIPVGEAMLGRVVSTLGEPLDGLGPIEAEKRSPIEREAYGPGFVVSWQCFFGLGCSVACVAAPSHTSHTNGLR